MKIAKTGLATFLLAVSLAGHAEVGSSMSSEINTAKDEVYRGNKQAALSILRPLAEQGNADAQYALAEIQLRKGWKDRNPAEGKKWLIKAAEQGHTAAQFDLANFYTTEEKNYTDALKWYLKLIEQHPEDQKASTAARNLGEMYSNGQGVAKAYGEAARWYRYSAERGDTISQYHLGMIYLEGLAGPKNFDEAVKWLGKAARQYKPASYTLTFIYAEGFDTKPDADEAAYWNTKSRYRNKGEAEYYVGKFYSHIIFKGPEEEAVLAWLFKRRGNAEQPAIYLSKYVELRGDQEIIHVAQHWGDQNEAVRWYRKGAEAGFVGAQVDLGMIMWDQESQYWNCAEAMKWMRLAAAKDDPTAMGNVGLFYFQGPLDRVVTLIGIEMEQTEKVIRVKRVISGSPAEAVGMQPEDIIVDINGTDASKLGVRGSINAIRSIHDKDVVLHVRQGTKGKLRTISVTPKETHFKCPGADSAGWQRDTEEATKWFEKAADHGNPWGLFILAEAYQKGTEVPQDFKKALEYYEKGADHGDWRAANAISMMYTTGELGEKNEELARRWHNKALDLEFGRGSRIHGFCC